jgi:hypothetical protein|nr:MAG TPA: hypothetical protein [Caudoviricetes sp.]
MKRYLVSVWIRQSYSICGKKLRPDSEVVSYEKT